MDMNITNLETKDLQWADYVFLSAMAVQKASAREIISRCNEAGVRTVAGGPLFTASREDFPEVDHLVLNEAENALPPFLHDLATSNAGIFTRHKNSQALTRHRSRYGSFWI